MSRFFSKMGKHKMTVILEEAEQLQGNRYGENDDSEIANVAVSTVHPLGRICNKKDKVNIDQIRIIRRKRG